MNKSIKRCEHIIFLLVGLVISSCNLQEDQSSAGNKEYFDLNGLLTSQLALLDSLKPTLEKTVTIAGKTEQASSIPDSLLWGRELAFFFDSDINRSVLQGAYEKAESSGSLMYEYKAKEEQRDGVERLEVNLEGNYETPTKIRIDFKEKNAVFSAAKKLTLNLSPESARIESYRIEGLNKIVLKDTLKYTISGKVQYRD